MCRVQYLLFVLVLALYEFSSVQSLVKKCKFSEVECMTEIGNRGYKAVVNGVSGLIDPIDPLTVEKASGDEGAFHYELRNITLTGMRNCVVDLMKYFAGAKITYEYYLHCPQLVFNYYYDVKGTLDGTELNGIGLGSETAEDYLIIIKGRSEKYISEKDEKIHLVLKEYQVETELKGKYKFETTKLIKGDKTKSDFVNAFLNDKVKAPEKYIQNPTLEKFWAMFMEAINKYLKEYPLEELLTIDLK